MRLLGLGAMALTLGLGGCMHGMDHHDGMMGDMMGQHGSANCPGAEQGAHGAPTANAAEAQGQAPAGECPPASEGGAEQHEHGEQQPN